MPWWGWIVIGVMLLGSEVIVTTDFYLAVLGAAALSVALLAGLGVEAVWMQWALFAGLAVGYLLGIRTRLSARLGLNGPEKALLSGDVATVQERIEPGETGAYSGAHGSTEDGDFMASACGNVRRLGEPGAAGLDRVVCEKSADPKRQQFQNTGGWHDRRSQPCVRHPG